MRRSHILCSLLLCAIAALLLPGCQDAGTPVDVTLQVFDATFNPQLTNADWAAFQDGNGAWRTIDPNDTGRYLQQVTDSQGRYGFAAVTDGRLNVLYATLAEMRVATLFGYHSARFTRGPTAGPPAGNRANEVILSGTITYGFTVGGTGVHADHMGADSIDTLTEYGVLVQPGQHDLIIMDHANPITWMYLARDLQVTGDTVFNADVTASNISQLVSGRSLSITDGAGTNARVRFYSKNGTLIDLAYNENQAATLPYNSLPSEALVDGDVYLFDVWVNTEHGQRQTFRYAANPATTTPMTLPPVYDTLNVTNIVAGDNRLTTFHGLSYPGALMYHASVYGQFGKGMDSVDLFVTPGWLHANGTTSASIPDLRAVAGWQSAWGVPTDDSFDNAGCGIYTGNVSTATALAAFYDDRLKLPDGTMLNFAYDHIGGDD